MSSLPRLGSQGQGWVVIQFILLGLVILSGLLAPRAEGGLAQVLGLVGLAFMAGGAMLLAVAIRDLGRNLTPTPMPRTDARLVEGGIYAIVRHPMYGALLLTALGWAFATASPITLVFVAVLAVFFDLKARREEAWLQERYPGYAEYMTRTRRLLPWVY